MQFEPLPLIGTWLIHPEMRGDDRGFFARVICVKEFAEHGLNGRFTQSSISYNKKRGTFRGMHFERTPSLETKLVRCIRGAVQDVLLDIRPGSATYLQHIQVTLDDSRRNAIYIPPGVAHGFQSLDDDAEVQYHMTEEFRPDLASGYRWNDPAFSIRLPLSVSEISKRDATYADFAISG